jgi:cytochrome c oxidase subunit 3
MSASISEKSVHPPGHGHGAHHDPHLAHHFDTPEQQFTSAKLGMWVFLGTEILMFGGLFCVYSIYRHNYPLVFKFASESYLSIRWGTLNTIILITSSLTMAWGVRAAQLNQRKLLIACLSMTLLGAAGFLVIKGIEYHAKWDEHVWFGLWNKYNGESTEPWHLAPPAQPTTRFAAVPPPPPVVPSSIVVDANSGVDVSQIKPRYDYTFSQAIQSPAGERPLETNSEENPDVRYRQLSDAAQWRVNTFFSCYFLMTGLHGIHVLVGMGLISWLLLRSLRNEFSSEYFTPVDLIGLYWHLVDLIWIFLFPLLYLIH